MIMDAPLRLVVALGAKMEEEAVVLRAVTPPRRRTLLTHGSMWSEAVAVDFPWVGESLEATVYERYVGTHVLLFESDPRLLAPSERVPCWNAGAVFGHGLGATMACIGYANKAASATFWNTTFHTVYVRSAMADNGSILRMSRPGWARRA